MRYQNWDVLVFPGLPDQCKIPLQEFKTSCTVIQDPETHSFQSSPHLLPTVTSFIPGLTAGSPFRVSIHCWLNPDLSRYIQTIKKPTDSVVFEARLFIDGRIVGSRWFHQNGPWPTVIEMSIDVDKNGEFEKLKFPVFHRELLSQSYWNASDDFGRIKLIISEGFAREHLTYPYERIKNIASFSFQHAPLDVLEASSIAWPNAAMWRQSNLVGPYIAQTSPRKNSSELELHSHSPRRGSGNGNVRAKQPGRAQGAMLPPSNAFPRPATTFDPFTDQIHSAFNGWRQSSSNDVSMLDYSSSSGHTRANSTRQVTDPMSITGEPMMHDTQLDSLLEAMGTRPPANTPQNGEPTRSAMPMPFPVSIPVRYDSSSASGTPRPSGEYTVAPSAIALDQRGEEEGRNAEPFTTVIHTASVAATVKSRKENINRSPDATRASSGSVIDENEITRSNVVVDENETNRKVSQVFTAINSASNKRQRVVTPAASKAIDDEDEPRSSPSTRKVSRQSTKEGQAQGQVQAPRRALSNVTNV